MLLDDVGAEVVAVLSGAVGAMVAVVLAVAVVVVRVVEAALVVAVEVADTVVGVNNIPHALARMIALIVRCLGVNELFNEPLSTVPGLSL